MLPFSWNRQQFSCKTFQNISVNNHSVVPCFSFAFLTNYLNQSYFIVSQGTKKLVLKNLYVLQQIISFVRATKGSLRYSDCHHGYLGNHDKHRLVLVLVVSE